MDFPNRLDNTNGNQRDSWNDEIEEFLGKPQSPSQNSISIEFDDDALQSSLEVVALELQKQLAASTKNCEIDECDGNVGRVVRTGKNLLRWYIQIYLEQRQVQRQRQKSQDGCKINVLRLPDTLSSVVRILKWSVEIIKNLKLARDASLYIFYATYSHFPGDGSASRGMDHLITQLGFPQTSLEILMKADSVPLALSLVRNLHSMAVSFPGAPRSILDAQVRCDSSVTTQSAPWAPKEPSSINFSLSCLALMRWSLDTQSTFPSDNPEDKRVELVVEILSCFYVMRKGQELVASSSGNTMNDDNPCLENVIIRILQLTFPAQSDNENSDEIVSKRIEQCKLSAVSLLIDSDASFGKYLLENGSFETLLEILKRQVDDIVDNTKVDSTATAALVPILVVLNKYSMADSVVQQQVKAFVFPIERENIFQQNIKENGKTKMSPLDAPKDTLRGKLVVLLSWVDGYIKRCSAELMWTLCDSDSFEFTRRVGLGNALPLLNSKGLSPVPIPS